MSKVKTPQDKKRLSYEHDRRNTYGENHKSSRKNIPRSKRLSHQDECRAVRQVLIAACTKRGGRGRRRRAVAKAGSRSSAAFRKSPDTSVRRGRRATAAPAEGQQASG